MIAQNCFLYCLLPTAVANIVGLQTAEIETKVLHANSILESSQSLREAVFLFGRKDQEKHGAMVSVSRIMLQCMSLFLALRAPSELCLERSLSGQQRTLIDTGAEWVGRQ
jgi:hypothetical protein